MWTMEHRVRLQKDEIPGEVVDFTVTDHMDEWPGLARWEQKVRDVAFQAMRKTVAGGLRLREHTLLRTWTHLDDDCHLVRRGRIPVRLTSTVGKLGRGVVTACWFMPLGSVPRSRSSVGWHV